VRAEEAGAAGHHHGVVHGVAFWGNACSATIGRELIGRVPPSAAVVAGARAFARGAEPNGAQAPRAATLAESISFGDTEIRKMSPEPE